MKKNKLSDLQPLKKPSSKKEHNEASIYFLFLAFYLPTSKATKPCS